MKNCIPKKENRNNLDIEPGVSHRLPLIHVSILHLSLAMVTHSDHAKVWEGNLRLPKKLFPPCWPLGVLTGNVSSSVPPGGLPWGCSAARLCLGLPTAGVWSYKQGSFHYIPLFPGPGVFHPFPFPHSGWNNSPCVVLRLCKENNLTQDT